MEIFQEAAQSLVPLVRFALRSMAFERRDALDAGDTKVDCQTVAVNQATVALEAVDAEDLVS